MRTESTLVLLCLLSAAALLAQDNTKRIFLSPKSNITTGEVADGFSKYCPNVVVTQNESKADYVLEAAEAKSGSQGTTHFTLMNLGGDVLMTTHPTGSGYGVGGIHFTNKFKHHFEEACKYINRSNKTK